MRAPSTRRRYHRSLLLVAVVAAAIAVPLAHAAGSLSETTTAAPTFSLTLDGTDQNATYTLPLTLADTRGTALGWNLTITSTQFSNGTRQLSQTASSLTSVSVSCSKSPCVNPVNTVTYPLTVPADTAPPAATKFYNAAIATGTGTFTVTPSVSVALPANAYKGTYTSTITLAVASGP